LYRNADVKFPHNGVFIRYGSRLHFIYNAFIKHSAADRSGGAV
jgi:hypothetical protein